MGWFLPDDDREHKDTLRRALGQGVEILALRTVPSLAPWSPYLDDLGWQRQLHSPADLSGVTGCLGHKVSRTFFFLMYLKL